jgi:hypothetical protein
MTRRAEVTDAAALLAWMDDAHAAVDAGRALTPPMLLALAATPARGAGRAHTWFLEEAGRVLRRQLRDPMPMTGPDAELARWRERQGRLDADLTHLLHQHAECLAAARAFVAGRAADHRRASARSRPARHLAARVALDAIALEPAGGA